MRILVTGAAGHIGRRVVTELASHGHIVRALDRVPLPRDAQHENVEMVYADVADPLMTMTHVAGCDAIVHLAAYPTPHQVSASELMRVNVIGTTNILDAAVAHGVKRAVITSSVGALGHSFPKTPCILDHFPIRADHPRRPQDVYGLSKLMNEENALTATRQSDISIIVMRPPYVADLQHLKNQGWLPRRVEWSAQHRDNAFWAYVDVNDLAVAYRLAVESDLTGYHVFYPMADDVMSIASTLELTEKFVPEVLEDVRKSDSRCFYDLAPIREKLGFEAKRTWKIVLEEEDKPA